MAKKRTKKVTINTMQNVQTDKTVNVVKKQPIPCVDGALIKCPRCTSLKSKIRTSRPTKNIMVVGDKKYTIRYVYKQCVECDQVFVVREPDEEII